MSNLIPLVDPPNSSLGTSVGISPIAIFEKAMDEGSVNVNSCFLVETTRKDNQTWDEILETSDFIFNTVISSVTSVRINLTDEEEYTGKDYGSDPDSGEQYRTKIIINPNNLLKPNTNYAVLLSKDLTTITVFDPQANVANSGNGTITLKGPYTGLVNDTYTITMMESGTSSSSSFVWSRSSDGHISGTIESKNKYITLDQGIKIKFLDGDFTIGDSYTVNVIPADNQADIYAWNFATGSGEYQEPVDERSDTIVGLPVEDGSATSVESFHVVKVEPQNGATLIPVARKSAVTVGDVYFLTDEYTSTYNDYTVEFIGGATAGNESVTIVNSTEIQISIEDGVSTAQQVVDAFNLFAIPITSSTQSPTSVQNVEAAKDFSNGVDENSFVLTFNKDIDETSITSDSIKALTRYIYPSTQPAGLSYSFQVSGNQLTIILHQQ